MVCAPLPVLAGPHKGHHGKDYHDDTSKIVLDIPAIHGKIVIGDGQDDRDFRKWEGENDRFRDFADRLDLSRDQRFRLRRVVSSHQEEGEKIRGSVIRQSRRIRRKVMEGERPGLSGREELQRDFKAYFRYQWRMLSRLDPILTSGQEKAFFRWVEDGRDIGDVLHARLRLTKSQRKEVREILRDFRNDNKELAREARSVWRSMARDAFRDKPDHTRINQRANRWSEAMTKLTVREGRLLRRMRPILNHRQLNELDDFFNRPLEVWGCRGY